MGCFDDFDIENDGFMDDDSFEDNLEEDLEMDEPLAGESECDKETDQAESEEDDFTPKDAFLAGSFAGWAYEEGLRERKRRKRKKSEDDDDSSVD